MYYWGWVFNTSLYALLDDLKIMASLLSEYLSVNKDTVGMGYQNGDIDMYIDRFTDMDISISWNNIDDICIVGTVTEIHIRKPSKKWKNVDNKKKLSIF